MDEFQSSVLYLLLLMFIYVLEWCEVASRYFEVSRHQPGFSFSATGAAPYKSQNIMPLRSYFLSIIYMMIYYFSTRTATPQSRSPIVVGITVLRCREYIINGSSELDGTQLFIYLEPWSRSKLLCLYEPNKYCQYERID